MSESASSEKSNNGNGGRGPGKAQPLAGQAGSGVANPARSMRDGDPTAVAEQPRGRFLIAAQYGRPEAADPRALRDAVEQLSEVEIVAMADDAAKEPAQPQQAWLCPPVLVVEASHDRMRGLAGSREWLIEADQALSPPAYRWAGPLQVADPSLLGVTAPVKVTIVVRDDDGHPVSAAAVYAHGAWPGYAVTGADGTAVLTLPAGCVDNVTALLVVPASGRWSRLVMAPQLTAGGRWEVTVQTLSASFDGFPERPHTTWGAGALRVGQLPPNYRGRGVKIAVVDSGIATDHPDLTGRITHGANLTRDSAGWDVDPLGSGTACAGIIAAADNDQGVTGLAVDAEVHAIKATPGGTLATLLQALDYCITQQIDIAQLNVTIPTGSQLLAAKLADVRNAGVTVIAPAGDTIGAVTMPAVLPEVIAVAAIGRPGTFPPGSVHTVHLTAQAGPDGDTAAMFTATGPGVDLAAPGVAVLTTAPDGGYIPRDGTTVAAAHITSLAALILAHHDDFTQQYAQHGPHRVDHLHRLLLASCQPLGDPRRTGAGVPDARRALGVATPLETDWETAVLHQLHLDLARAGLLAQRS